MTTTGLVMYDTVTDGAFPRGAPAYAAYLDGQVGDQPNFSFIVAEFPNAFHLSITVDPEVDADAADVEAGFTVPEALDWYGRQRARGAQRPCLYASASTMQAGIVPLVRAGRIPRGQVRLWSAHYAGQHICGPGSCGAVGIGMDGTQWTQRAWGRNLDESLLLPAFFDAPAPPKRAPAPPPDLEEEMPAGVITVEPGIRESHTWPEGTVRQIVLYSDWHGLQDTPPVVELRISHLTGETFDAGQITLDKTMVYTITSPSDCNGCSLTRGDAGHATVAWHTNS
jgi:hypothetical protein